MSTNKMSTNKTNTNKTNTNKTNTNKSPLDHNVKARKEDTEQNGNMVNGVKDMEKLGKEMEEMKTSKELEEDGQVPDPIQEIDEHKNKEKGKSKGKG